MICPTCQRRAPRPSALDVAHRVAWGVLTFVLAAYGALALLRDRDVAKQPVVVVIDCQAEPDLCSAVVSAAAVSAGDADHR